MGGVLVISPDSFGCTTKPIKTSSDRLCALNLHVDCISLYLFCVYMPCDCNESENLNECDNIMSEISLLCVKYNAEYVCITGDLNTGFTRTSSWHTKFMNTFIKNENLYAVVKHVKTNVDYTYVNDYNSTCSVMITCLSHITYLITLMPLWSTGFYRQIARFMPIEINKLPSVRKITINEPVCTSLCTVVIQLI